MKKKIQNQMPTTSASLGGCSLRLPIHSRKRKHETERVPKSERENSCSFASDASDLESLFHELAIVDNRIEKINVKDVNCQEFIDRIGKLYKPVLIEQNSSTNKASINERLRNIDTAVKIRCNSDYASYKHQAPKKMKTFNECNIPLNIREELLKQCTEYLHLSFVMFDDVIMSPSVLYLGEAFARNESLNRILCERIDAVTNKMTEDEVYDHTIKVKRRKVMSFPLI